MDTDDVIAALEAPTDNRLPAMERLEAGAPVAALAGALASAEAPLTRQLAADLLGRRADPGAGAALLAALEDPDSSVRGAAADAVAKVMLTHGAQTVPEAGPALLRAYAAETGLGTRRTMVGALGAAGHREAIPLLRREAQSPDAGLAHMARWALEQLEPGT